MRKGVIEEPAIIMSVELLRQIKSANQNENREDVNDRV